MKKYKIFALALVIGLIVFSSSIFSSRTNTLTRRSESQTIPHVSASNEPETKSDYEVVFEKTAEEPKDQYDSEWDLNREDYESIGISEDEIPYATDEEKSRADEEINASMAEKVTRERIIDYAAENYGVSEEWTIWLIGTTWNEGYHDDRYLEYAWASEIVNTYHSWSVYDLDCIWGNYYSISHAYEGYYNADDTCLEMVYQALTDPDTRICEVDGMITSPPSNYYLIYDSPYYNCQVWGS